MSNWSSTSVSDSTTPSLASLRALCGEPGSSTSLAGRRVGDVAGRAASCSTRAGRSDVGGGTSSALGPTLLVSGGAEGLRVRRVDDLLATLAAQPPGRGASRPGGVARFSPGAAASTPSSSRAFCAAWRNASSPSRSGAAAGAVRRRALGRVGRRRGRRRVAARRRGRRSMTRAPAAARRVGSCGPGWP